MERAIRLNLGCGPHKWPGWRNHDMETDMFNLPYEDETVSEISAIHFLEHLERDDAPLFIAECHRVLVPRGTLAIEVPDLGKIAQMVVEGKRDNTMTLWGIFGKHKGVEEMRHRWCYTTDELQRILTGFEVDFKEPVFHYKQRDVRAEATKL